MSREKGLFTPQDSTLQFHDVLKMAILPPLVPAGHTCVSCKMRMLFSLNLQGPGRATQNSTSMDTNTWAAAVPSFNFAVTGFMSLKLVYLLTFVECKIQSCVVNKVCLVQIYFDLHQSCFFFIAELNALHQIRFSLQRNGLVIWKCRCWQKSFLSPLLVLWSKTIKKHLCFSWRTLFSTFKRCVWELRLRNITAVKLQ